MFIKAKPNQGRQPVVKLWRYSLGLLRRGLKSPKTLSLLMGWMRFIVSVVRLFDRW